MLPAAPRRHRFSVDDYHRMGTTGLLGDDARVELLDGEIIDMAPIGAHHNSVVDRLTRGLVRAVGDAAIVRVQGSFHLSDLSEPQPDAAVLRPSPDFYASALPRPDDVLLVVEVAGTTLGWDLDVKAPLYARAGIARCWVVDVDARAVHVLTDPTPDGYASAIVGGPGDVLDTGAGPLSTRDFLS